jgi:KaiC/GvpD/RAD55 family RecA-like ATPase
MGDGPALPAGQGRRIGAPRRSMVTRSTYIPELDTLLGGGLRPGETVLLEGMPEAGHLACALHIVCRAAAAGEHAVLLSVHLSSERLAEEAAAIGWDLQALEQDGRLRCIYTSPFALALESGDDGLLWELIDDFAPSWVLIDHAPALELAWEGRVPFTLRLRRLLAGLTARHVVTLMGAGWPAPRAQNRPERSLADIILRFELLRVEQSQSRCVRLVHGRRGCLAVLEPLPFDCTRHGLLFAPLRQHAAFHVPNAVSSGLPSLDTVLGGGVPYGRVYLYELEDDDAPLLLQLALLHQGAESSDCLIYILPATADFVRLQARAVRYGMRAALVKAVDEGRLRVIDPFDRPRPGSANAIITPAPSFSDPGFVDWFVELCAAAQPERTRMLLDIGDLIAAMGPERFVSALPPLLAAIRLHRIAAYTLAMPDVLPPKAVCTLRRAVDGRLRLWQDHFGRRRAQVLASVTGARTEPLPVLFCQGPPFLDVVRTA